MKCNVLAMRIDKRINSAIKVQEVLTKHGCIIQNRMGFHEANDKVCSECGIIILTLMDNPSEIEQLMTDLGKIEGLHSSLVTL